MNGAFPGWLPQQPNTRELQQTYRQIPGAFNTQGVEDSYNARMGLNMAQAQSTTGSMARAAANRAFRTGGQVASSFAAGSAMLPYYEQNQSMMGDLADYKLRAAQSRIQAQAGIGEALAGFRQRQTGMMGDFYNSEQNRSQQGGQFDRNLAQQAAEFRANNALRLRQQGFAEDQYDDALALQNREEGRAQRSSGTPTWAQAGAIMGAVNSNSPQALNYWQRLQAAASQGGFENSPIFSTGEQPPQQGGYRRRSYY